MSALKLGAQPRLVALCMIAAGVLGLPSLAAAQLFRKPVACESCINYYYYRDQGNGGDWNCGSTTYSGHTGSDYSLGAGNRGIATGYDVVAMAAGVVRHTEDGYFDQCTQCGGANCGTNFGNGFANQVRIDHGDTTVTYGHMRNGSIAVSVGDEVTCGQVIGQIGSSGCSTGAHLHIETIPVGQSFNRSFDPYEGPCSPSAASKWVEQGAYRMLPSAQCDDGPVVPTCPEGTYDIWTCESDLSARTRCVNGEAVTEPCEWGCSGMPAGTDDLCTMPPDTDGDGSRADVDCDDANMNVHPGAVDVCGDGIDQDCSGADGVCPVEAPDADGDGIRADVDCNDQNPAAFPGALEVCGDGVDQDCDGVDTMCPPGGDADADGVPAATDCNDQDPTVRPGAIEVCGDGIDQDCDGIDAPCSTPPVAGQDGQTFARPAAEDGCGCQTLGASHGRRPGSGLALGLGLLLLCWLRTRARSRLPGGARVNAAN